MKEERYVDFLVAPYCLVDLFLAFDNNNIKDFAITKEDNDLHIRIKVSHLEDIRRREFGCSDEEYLLEGPDTNMSLAEEEKQKLTEVLIKKLKQDRNSDFWYFYLKKCVKYLDYAYFSLSEILNDVYDAINNDEKSTLNLIASLDYIENDLLIKYFEKLIIAISQNSNKCVRYELDAFLDSRFLSIENNHLIDDLLEENKNNE